MSVFEFVFMNSCFILKWSCAFIYSQAPQSAASCQWTLLLAKTTETPVQAEDCVMWIRERGTFKSREEKDKKRKSNVKWKQLNSQRQFDPMQLLYNFYPGQ